MKRSLSFAFSVVFLMSAPAAAAPDWRAAVRTLLTERERAVSKGNRASFDATMVFAPDAFKRERDAWFTRLRALPLGTYSLELAEDGYLDLAPALRARPAGDEVHVAQVTQHLGFRGYDKTPSADDMFLTVVRRGSRWSIVSDSDLEDIGLESARDVWDFAPVTTVEGEGVLVISHGDARAADIATATAAAAARDHANWPLKWSENIIDAVPATRAELGRILQVTFDLGPFVAFTSSSLDRTGGGFTLTAHRVYIQPQNFFSDSPAYRDDTLSHEIIHLATRAASGAFTPSWLDEGVAQVYGQRAVATAFGGAAQVPDDWEFNIGSDSDINRAYARAANFVSWMRAHYGRAAPARLYAALGKESAVSFGTRRYHLDRASRSALGSPFDVVVRAWQRAEGK